MDNFKDIAFLATEVESLDNLGELTEEDKQKALQEIYVLIKELGLQEHE